MKRRECPGREGHAGWARGGGRVEGLVTRKAHPANKERGQEGRMEEHWELDHAQGKTSSES